MLDSRSEIVVELDADLRFSFRSAAWDRTSAVPVARAPGQFATDLTPPAARGTMSEEVGGLARRSRPARPAGSTSGCRAGAIRPTASSARPGS